MVRTRAAARVAQARTACIGILAVLVACAPRIAPQGLDYQSPQLTADFFLTRDGLRLPVKEWDAQKPEAVIVALHGMSDYSEAFDMPAPWWANRGITTIAYDQRGFGRAPDPGLWAGAETMRRDLDDCVDAARAKFPGLPVFALGESMGGAIVLSALADARPPAVDGAILVAPAIWSRSDMPLSYRVALWVAAHTVPWLHVSGKGLHIWPSDNVPMLRKLSRDPLFQHEARVDQVYGLVNLMDAARNAASRLASPPPILLLYGAKDQIIPAGATESVVAALGPHADDLRDPDGYHMLLRGLDAEIEWRQIADWIGKDRAQQSARKADDRF